MQCSLANAVSKCSNPAQCDFPAAKFRWLPPTASVKFLRQLANGRAFISGSNSFSFTTQYADRRRERGVFLKRLNFQTNKEGEINVFLVCFFICVGRYACVYVSDVENVTCDLHIHLMKVTLCVVD